MIIPKQELTSSQYVHKTADACLAMLSGKVELSTIGRIAHELWQDIPRHFKNVTLDTFIVMPNHLHGIILINQEEFGLTYTEKGAETAPLRECTLGQIVAYYKYQTTKLINQLRNTFGNRVWQRNYYDRIIKTIAYTPSATESVSQRYASAPG